MGWKTNFNANLWKGAYRFAEEAAVESTYLKPKFELDWFETNCWDSMLVMSVNKLVLLLCCDAFNPLCVNSGVGKGLDSNRCA